MSIRSICRGGQGRPGGVRLALASTLSLLLLVTGATADWHIKQVTSLDRGITWTYGYPVPYRLSSHSPLFLVFTAGVPNSVDGVHFYRYVPFNRYRLVKVDTGGHGDTVISPGWMIPWAASDIDGDSQNELVAMNSEYHPGSAYLLAALYGLPSQGLCPDSLLWRGRYDSLVVYGSEPFYITDLDQDGKKEITFFNPMDEIDIFENVCHDSMRLVAALPCNFTGHGMAFGDFDSDGNMEFAIAGIDGSNWVHIYKCLGDNSYAPWDSIAVSLPNGTDVFEGHNLDGSHHATFFVSFWSASGQMWLYQFEPTQGNKDYQPFPVDSGGFSTGDVNARSICGDIDGDGLDEVIWSMGSQIQAYECMGPHQWQQIWYWWNGGGNSCNINLYDMNGDGYNEIIESGSGRTHIFEIEALRVLNPNTNITLHPGDTCRIRWETFTPPRCDSVSLFLRTDTSWTLDTLIHGLPPSDTDWVWTVPNIRSDYCHVVAIAYGPGWQYDESDTFFRIAPLGVEEVAAPEVSETKLLGAFPNPLTALTRVQFQLREQGPVNLRICDVSGRTVATLADGVLKPGVYHRNWEVAPTVPNGIYFIRLETPDCRETRKVILLRS